MCWKITLLMFAAGWQKPASDIFFSLQATLQTSPSGHTTSFQMFNHTYKLYSYRLVVEKRAQCSDGSFLWSQGNWGVFLVWGPCKLIPWRNRETWATWFWWINLGCPPSPSITPILLTGQGEENRTKSSWVKIRPGKSPVIVMGETDLTLI